MSLYRTFSWKDSNFRIRSDQFEAVTHEIVEQRTSLEGYIRRHPEFRTALVPVDLRPGAPNIAWRMARASALTGIGPMAAVAGTIAQLAAEAGLRAGAQNTVVENGGDIFLAAQNTVVVGLYSGQAAVAADLAFRVSPKQMPLALCSSSSRMGHSTSFGDCDLATVTAPDASLADAAATLACNLVKDENDIKAVLDHVGSIPGVSGVFLAKGGHVGLIGELPELVRNADDAVELKVTRDSSLRAR